MRRAVPSLRVALLSASSLACATLAGLNPASAQGAVCATDAAGLVANPAQGIPSGGATAAACGNLATASGLGASAFGDRAVASGNFSTALGDVASALSTNATAVGRNADVTAAATNGTALGSETRTTGVNAAAVGWRSTATGTSSSAFGDRSVASGNFSTAIGDFPPRVDFNRQQLATLPPRFRRTRQPWGGMQTSLPQRPMAQRSAAHPWRAALTPPLSDSRPRLTPRALWRSGRTASRHSRGRRLDLALRRPPLTPPRSARMRKRWASFRQPSDMALWPSAAVPRSVIQPEAAPPLPALPTPLSGKPPA